MSTAIPEKVRAKIIADYLAGMSHSVAAKKHGVSRASATRITAAAGVKRGVHKPTPAQMNAAVADYIGTGDSIRTIAGRHPVTEDSLRRVLRKRGEVRTGRRPATAEARAVVVADYANGMSSVEAGRKHGVSGSTVLAWARAAHVDIKNPGPGSAEEPLAYDGRWMLIGGTRKPTKPMRGVAA